MRTRDNRQRFLIESCDVRGQLVQLDRTWHDVLARSDYPPAVREVLGEAFVAALLLAGTIKFDGRLTLQVRGAGPVHLLVVQVTHDGRVRGLARHGSDQEWSDPSELAGTNDRSGSIAGPVSPESASSRGEAGASGRRRVGSDHAGRGPTLTTLFGEDARMIITIEGREFAEPYQGVVALGGERLTDALESYFRDSEQLPTALFVAVGEAAAAGLLLQTLPADERVARDEDGWRRAVTLAATLRDAELLERDVDSLLGGLYHEERVRLFDGSAVRFECSCSRARTDGMLEALGAEEVESILEEHGAVSVTCEFCDAEYRYDAVDVAALFHGAGAIGGTRH